jgi:hypothetical protein
MTIKYTNILHYIQGPPKFPQRGIFGLIIHHLATLLCSALVRTTFFPPPLCLSCSEVSSWNRVSSPGKSWRLALLSSSNTILIF